VVSKPRKLTKRETKFIEELPKDRNATQAAIRAGYSKKTAAQIASQNLRKLHISEKVEKQEIAATKRNELTVDWVLKNLKREATRSPDDTTGGSRVKALELVGKHLGMWSDRDREDAGDWKDYFEKLDGIGSDDE
jgi:phage terminase small subunit